MYRLAVQRDFIAQHYLIGGDYGPENDLHSHHYRIEVQLSGTELNSQGYLVDIVEVEESLERTIAIFRETTLNDHPAFEGLNPSLEHFARILHIKIREVLLQDGVDDMMVRLWEDENTYVDYRDSS